MTTPPVRERETLCISCAEEILGRKLSPNDFGNAPINFERLSIFTHFCNEGKWESPEEKQKISQRLKEGSISLTEMITSTPREWYVLEELRQIVNNTQRLSEMSAMEKSELLRRDGEEFVNRMSPSSRKKLRKQKKKYGILGRCKNCSQINSYHDPEKVLEQQYNLMDDVWEHIWSKWKKTQHN